jgi:hypothetical protein
MATLSTFDTTGQAFERGGKAEDKFAVTLKNRFPGKRVVPASPTEERIQHWDYKLCLDPSCDSSKAIKYEVKAVRKLEMRDENPQDKFFPVEFLSVDGHPGWVYGKANYIAFETLGGDWILVKPADLLQMATAKVIQSAARMGIEITSIQEALNDSRLRVMRSRDGLYKIYGRAGRGDALTWVRREDILALPHEVWKPGEVSQIQEPATIRVTPKRGMMGPGGKQLWTTEVSVWQGSKLIASVPLQGKWDQMKIEEILKTKVPQDKWTAEELVKQLRSPQFVTPPPVGGFREWVIWHDKTIR